jgi:hypothetical protein
VRLTDVMMPLLIRRGRHRTLSYRWVPASKAPQFGLSLRLPLRARSPSRTRGNNIFCSELFVLGRSAMDDYSGRLNFLALVGAALLVSVVVIGFSGHDNGQMEDIKTASIVAPAMAHAK